MIDNQGSVYYGDDKDVGFSRVKLRESMKKGMLSINSNLKSWLVLSFLVLVTLITSMYLIVYVMGGFEENIKETSALTIVSMIIAMIVSYCIGLVSANASLKESGGKKVDIQEALRFEEGSFTRALVTSVAVGLIMSVFYLGSNLSGNMAISAVLNIMIIFLYPLINLSPYFSLFFKTNVIDSVKGNFNAATSSGETYFKLVLWQVVSGAILTISALMFLFPLFYVFPIILVAQAYIFRSIIK